MRNLRSIGHSVQTTPSQLTAVCWDAVTDEVILAHGPSLQKSKIVLSRASGSGGKGNLSKLTSRAIASWDTPSPSPDLAVDKVVALHHFSDARTTCLALAGGDIVIVQEQDDAAGEARIEIVGSIDERIAAAKWSPDEELLVAVTAAQTAVFMSRSFDPIFEVNFSPEDLKTSKHVSVGWGKKETQFHGKGAKAKALRDPTIPDKADQGTLSLHDDGRTTISWRGDGAYVAINSVQPGVRRVIRVYNREGTLDSVSEPVDGLEGSLSWRPSGNLMASIQRCSSRVDVVFFERNGLRHGQFTLRVSEGQPDALEDVALEWNSDSTVLAVALKDRVQLWTTGNYHWYLKQEMFCGTARPHLSWHPERALRLATAAGARLFVDEYIFVVARGAGRPPHDHGAVAVIDGQTVKITPFRTANVPPPMALFEIEATSAVIDVAFSEKNEVMAVLHQAGVDIYDWKTKDQRSVPPKRRGTLSLQGQSPVSFRALQVGVAGDAQVAVLSRVVDEACGPSQVLDTWSLSEWKPLITRNINHIQTLCSSSCLAGSYGGFVLQNGAGKLYRIIEGEEEPLTCSFPTHLPWTEFAQHHNQMLAVGMSSNGHLYVSTRQLAKNCTSFLLTGDHLVLTTSNHLVKFVHLTDLEDLEVPPDDPEKDERCRSIERGAKLVTAMPTTMNVVLQMPRGNLETIYPRAMVLAGIRQLIDDRNYKKAFEFCRTQRVDMNILHDHKPDQFHANVDSFLDQVKDLANIDLFLSSLREEDVTQTLYRDTKTAEAKRFLLSQKTPAQALPPLPVERQSKVNKICDAVLDSLRSQKTAKLQNIITANVCKIPPAIEDGLSVVVELLEDESLAERAVEHICLLVDVNRVYDQALGMYNLDLALLVAQQSQRDPREYMPFIQKLHELAPLSRQFAIDDHLGRHEKALGHLQKLELFEDVKKYTIQHELYRTAFGLYRYDEARGAVLTQLYAAYLEDRSKYREAGLAYESLRDFNKATACYQAAGVMCWRECLVAAHQQTPPLSPAAIHSLAKTLAEALYEAKDYFASATIHIDYLLCAESAIRHLCKGYHFADALRLITRQHRPELLEEVLDPALADSLSNSMDFLAECNAQLKAQVPRILELRRKAAEDPLAFYEGEDCGGGDLPDDVSVAASSRLSTSASLFTRYTGSLGVTTNAGSQTSRSSSRQRRREEKKRARGRKGTVYEEDYLVNSVRRLVERVNGTKEEVERLVFALVRRRMSERARAVEGFMEDLVEACERAVGLVWPNILGMGEDGGEGAMSAAKMSEPPVVGRFEKLSLLG